MSPYEPRWISDLLGTSRDAWSDAKRQRSCIRMDVNSGWAGASRGCSDYVETTSPITNRPRP
eukprot:1940403-Lingulodinium_polyedra.AAC.1